MRLRKRDIVDLFNKCKVVELSIEKDKAYIGNIEVGGMPVEQANNLIAKVQTVCIKELKLTNCVFAAMVNGQRLLDIAKITEDEVKHITRLYNIIPNTELMSS